MAHACSTVRRSDSESWQFSTHVAAEPCGTKTGPGGELEFEALSVGLLTTDREETGATINTHTHAHTFAHPHMREHACRKYGPRGRKFRLAASFRMERRLFNPM